MLFLDKISSIWDEASWNSDSFSRSSLYKIQSYAYSQGAFEGADFTDYYLLSIPGGDYTLYVTTEGLNASSVFSSSFKTEIVDQIGNVVLNEDLSHPDLYTDQISFTYTGTGDYYVKITSFAVADFSYRAAVYFDSAPVVPVPPVVPAVPEPSDWTLLANDGLFVAIGGKGQVFGTTKYQSVAVLDVPGIVHLDGSFNKGGDLITLLGTANEWQAARSGSSVVLYDGDTFVQIPVGLGLVPLWFDDGPRTLRLDTNAGVIKIGNFSVGDAYAPIVASAEVGSIPPGQDSDATGSLIMSKSAEVWAGGNLLIFGTSGAETVSYLVGTVVFDGSFNKGGDTIILSRDASDFSAKISGSTVILDDLDETRIQIPVGPNGLDLVFDDGTEILRYDIDAGAVFIGDQQITDTSTPLTFA